VADSALAAAEFRYGVLQPLKLSGQSWHDGHLCRHAA
jgi:hypothetical protein